MRLVVRYRFAVLGAHVHVRMFVGPDADHLALAGSFVMRDDEWALFRLPSWGCTDTSFVEDGS